jgi:uncharacterized protein with GYD domain
MRCMAIRCRIDSTECATGDDTSPDRGETMATFITLANFTDQGVKAIKESPDRFDAVKALAEKLGIAIKSFHYTIGQYDMVLTIEGTEEAALTLALKIGSLGNVRTQTLRAYGVDEMKKVLGKMP